MATKVLDIVNRSLRLLGVAATGETADSPEAIDGFNVLNMMIESWSTEKLMIYSETNTLFTVTAGTGSYLIGPGQTWNAARPQKIEGMFIRDNTPGYNNDYVLEQVSNNKYQQVFQKALQTTYPKYFWYDPSYPYGVITLWPVPIKNMQANVSQWNPLVKFTTLAQTVTLPPGYDLALSYGLAYEMAPEYGIDQNKYKEQMNESKAKLMRINKEIMLLTTDSALQVMSPQRGFNIYGGM